MVKQHDENAYEIAEKLLNVMHPLGRRIELHTQSVAEEATLMQIRVLFYLLKQPITTSELAKKQKVTLQSASVQVQGVVDRGWVVRVPDENDRRQFLLQVTSEGYEQAEKATTALTRFVASFIEQLTPDEIAAGHIFLSAFQRVLLEESTSTHPD